jgi:hypothetical protein
MNKLFSLIVIAFSIVAFSCCNKDSGKVPNIAFKTGTGYTSADITVAKGTVILMGITASKAEDKDVLKTFDASQSYDGGASTSIASETLSGGNGDNYTKDVTITTRTVNGTEKYTFTVVNKDGLKNSISITVTTN